MNFMRYLARSGGLLGFAELVRRHGHDPVALLSDVGLPVTALQNPDLYLSYPRLAALYERTAQALDEHGFGLLLGRQQGLEVVGALGAWLCQQHTMGEALLGLQRNLGFHARGIQMHSELSHDVIRLDLQLAFADDIDCRQMMMLSLTLLERGMTDLQPAHLLPQSVRMGMPRPAAALVRACEEFFRCPVQFGGRDYSLSYPLALLAQPVAVTPRLQARLQQHWRDDWQLAPVSISMQVDRSISALLPTGECSLETVARLVGLHPRTLQVRLQAESTHYDARLRAVREELACTHLAESDIDLTRLALDLGYAELAVFSRAFKDWTGLPPSRWRQSR